MRPSIPVLLACSLLLCASAAPLPAQSAPNRADPALYFAMVRIGKLWDPSAFVQPPGTIRRLADTLVSNGMPVGFSVVDKDTAAGGWTFWMDFDGDRYLQPRLARVIAQGPAEGDGKAALDRLAAWMEKVLGAHIGPRGTAPDGVIRWPWSARGEYELTARRARRSPSDPWMLVVRLTVR